MTEWACAPRGEDTRVCASLTCSHALQCAVAAINLRHCRARVCVAKELYVGMCVRGEQLCVQVLCTWGRCCEGGASDCCDRLDLGLGSVKV